MAATGINRKINFQGKLVNNGATAGTNVTDASYTMKFTLWDASSAGTSLWTEVWNSGTTQVAVSSGIFSVALGSYSTFPPSVDFNTDNIYLSVGVSSDSDMTPRIQFTAVPYALNAEKASGQSLSITDLVSFGGITIGGTGLYGNLATTGKMSIGTTVINTVYALNVGGTYGGSDLYLTGKIGIGTSVPGVFALNVGGTGRFGDIFVNGKIAIGSTVPGVYGLNLGTSGFATNFSTSKLSVGTTAFFGAYNLNVGGTTSLTDLHILAKVAIGSTVPGVYALNVGGTYGGSDLYLTGRIGIGTSIPGYKLQIVGDANISTNLGIGGSLSLTALPVGVGTSVLYIASNGVITQGTLPVTSVVNSKVIVLSPEYPGGALSADGSGTTAVSMTSDNTLNAGGVGWKNYYELSSTSGSLQDYSVLVRVTLPSDFGSWETGSCPGSTCALEFAYQTGVGTTGDNAVSYLVSNDVDTPGTTVCSIGNTANTSWGSSGCTEATLNDGVAPEWDAASETAVIRVKMASKSTASALARVGDIILRYRSRF